MNNHAAAFANEVYLSLRDILSSMSIHTDTSIVTTPYIKEYSCDIHKLHDFIAESMVNLFNNTIRNLVGPSVPVYNTKFLVEPEDFDGVFDLTFYSDFTTAEINCKNARTKLGRYALYNEVLHALKFPVYESSHLRYPGDKPNNWEIKVVVHDDYDATQAITNKNFLEIFEYFNWRVQNIHVKRTLNYSQEIGYRKTIEIALDRVLTA